MDVNNIRQRMIDVDLIKSAMNELALDHTATAKLILEETKYDISRTTIGRILRHEAKPAITSFVRYALENVLKKGASNLVAHPDFIGKFETNEDSESYVVTYFVIADDAEEAIKKLASYGFNMQGARNETDHDCSGQWCASAAHPRNCVYIPVMGAWSVSMYWVLDV